MAKNWTAYEAAVELYGDNKENIAEIGSRYPLFTREVCLSNDEYLLDILKALPKVTARVVETGLKEMEAGEIEEDTTEVVEEKQAKKTTKKKAEDDDTVGYESMTATELYKLCCERGISSKCKSRKKDALIELLEAYDRGEVESTKDKEKKEKTKSAKKSAPKKEAEPEEDEDDWGDEEEEENPYAGKTAMELFKECKKRGISAKAKMKPEYYVDLLTKDDEKEVDSDEDEDDEDDWEI